MNEVFTLGSHLTPKDFSTLVDKSLGSDGVKF